MNALRHGFAHDANREETSDEALPYLEVRGPSGIEFSKRLRGARVTIGRGGDNDIVLQPDPMQWVTAQGHCVLERSDDAWLATDHSTNGTWLWKDWQWSSLARPTSLSQGNIVRIRAGVQGELWDLTYCDPLATQPLSGAPVLTVDADRQQAFILNGRERRPVALTPNEFALLAFMVKSNEEVGDVAECSSANLIKAVWADGFGYTETNLAALVKATRDKLDPGRMGSPGRFLLNGRTGFYRLVTRPLPDIFQPDAHEVEQQARASTRAPRR
jgi:DNA-binding response OmpR family regulator